MTDCKYTKNCVSCKPIDTAERARTIFTTKHCRVVLRTDDQSWLGRCIIVPRRHVSSFEQLSEDELLDIYDCRRRICFVYKKVFGMTYDNWAQLGNLTVDEKGEKTTVVDYFHIHYHIIPRYANETYRLNRVFYDEQFGKPLNIDPACGHKKLVLGADELVDLRDKIQCHLGWSHLISQANLVDTDFSEEAKAACYVYRDVDRVSIRKRMGILCFGAFAVGLMVGYLKG